MSCLLLSAYFYYVSPPCSGILTLEIVLDGIRKDICLAFAILICILLRAEDNGF